MQQQKVRVRAFQVDRLLTVYIMYTEHEEATDKFSRVSKVRETDKVSPLYF